MNKSLPTLQSQPRWIDRAFVAVILFGCVAVISHQQADADLWGHVQYGREALAAGVLPRTTTHSFTAAGHPWINHENLSELALAVVVDSTGPVGLLVMKAAFGFGIFALLLWIIGRQGAGSIVLALLPVLAALNLSSSWTLRPQLFTIVAYVLLLAILEFSFGGWSGSWQLPWFRRQLGSPWDAKAIAEFRTDRLRWLWLVPLLMAIWTNTHGGFVAGFFIFSMYLGCRVVEAVLARGPAARPIVAQIGAVFLVTSAATFLNPYGIEYHRWLLSSLGSARPEISEWAPMSLGEPGRLIPFALMAAVTLGALGLARRSRDFTHIVVLAACAWQTASHMRHAPFFALAAAFWMPGLVESALSRLRNAAGSRSESEGITPRARWWLGTALAASVVVLAVRIADRISDVTVDRSEFPVAAIQFMADEQIEGPLVVTYNWAQYAIAALGDRSPVAFDGRFRTCYPEDVIDMHFDFLLGDHPTMRRRRSGLPPEPDRVLHYQRPTLVLIDRGAWHAVDVMHRQTDWTLLYQDGLAQLWGWKPKFDNPKSADYLAPSRRRVGNDPQTGLVSWPALPKRTRRSDDSLAGTPSTSAPNMSTQSMSTQSMSTRSMSTQSMSTQSMSTRSGPTPKETGKYKRRAS
jgi:hypothetical protein